MIAPLCVLSIGDAGRTPPDRGATYEGFYQLDGIRVYAAALAGGIGIGLLGSKAAEATGRNPGAATPILVISIILAALIEGIFILSAFAVGFE